MSSPKSELDHQAQLLQLKEFQPSGRGSWAAVPAADWDDWRWQLKDRVSSLEGLQSRIPDLTNSEIEGARLADTKLAMAITPHFFNLIDKEPAITGQLAAEAARQLASIAADPLRPHTDQDYVE